MLHVDTFIPGECDGFRSPTQGPAPTEARPAHRLHLCLPGAEDVADAPQRPAAAAKAPRLSLVPDLLAEDDSPDHDGYGDNIFVDCDEHWPHHPHPHHIRTPRPDRRIPALDADRRAAILRARRAGIRARVTDEGRAAAPAHHYDPALVEMDALYDLRCALYPPTDTEAEDHERRMRVVARSMNAALLVTVAPVGLAAMTYAAVRGADLRVTSRIMTVTALFLGACQQGLSWQIGGLIS